MIIKLFLIFYFTDSQRLLEHYFYKESITKTCIQINAEDDYSLPKGLYGAIVHTCYDKLEENIQFSTEHVTNFTLDWQPTPCSPSFYVTRVCQEHQVAQIMFDFRSRVDEEPIEKFGFISLTPFELSVITLNSTTNKRFLTVNLNNGVINLFSFGNSHRYFKDQVWNYGDKCVLLRDSVSGTISKLYLSEWSDRIVEMFLGASKMSIEVNGYFDASKNKFDRYNFNYKVDRVSCGPNIRYNLGFLSPQAYNEVIVKLQLHPFMSRCPVMSYRSYKGASNWQRICRCCPIIVSQPINFVSRDFVPRRVNVISLIKYNSESFNCGFIYKGEFLTKHIYQDQKIIWTSWSVASSNEEGGIKIFKKLTDSEIQTKFNNGLHSSCRKL